MTNNDVPTQSTSSSAKYDFEIDCLYQDIYYAFEREVGIVCSIDDFNEYIDKDKFKSHLLSVIEEKGTDSADLHSHVLGFVVPGINTVSPTVLSPAGRGQAMYSIAQTLFPSTTATAKAYADLFNMDLAVGMEAMADQIGAQMKGVIASGANIFNRGGRGGNSSGGGGRTNDQGDLEISGMPYNSYFHHEPVKNTLNWNLDIDNTMLGIEPKWNSNHTRTCFVSKFNMMQFPNDDDSLKDYYEYTLIPVIRNAMQANKRYTADLSAFFTYNMFKAYINEVIQSISIYYFFANGFAYCNEPGLVNNNEAIRYLRQELFNTTQLQRFQQLGQLLESLPIPQTLINAIAQYHGWYSNSPESGATLYCNIPHGIFKDNNATNPATGNTCTIDTLQSDVLLGEIEKLNNPIISPSTDDATNRRNSDKFLGILLNTIPGWRASTVEGSFFATDLYDEAHWNEFINSPTVHKVRMYLDNTNLDVVYQNVSPVYVSSTANNLYYSMGSNVPGYLQAYWTPIKWTTAGATTLEHHGFIKTQPRATKWNLKTAPGIGVKCETYSNVMVWCNNTASEAGLTSTSGTSMDRGFTLYPSHITEGFASNIVSPTTWSFDNGTRSASGYSTVYATARSTYQQPPCTYNTTNMSLVQSLPNRLIAIQKLLDVQDFFTLTSPTANKEKGGRRGRRSNAKSQTNPSSDKETEMEKGS